MQKKETACSPS
uniref:Uncharacterized protein n=1 Tax=Anguilla anguilla TaxID=7936 RepID=A0A0E9S6L6_ANGAN